MKFKAEIDVMPLDALLDPQGKAVSNSMGSIGLPEIEGKRSASILGYSWRPHLKKKLRKVLKRLVKILSNQIMESYSFSISEV